VTTSNPGDRRLIEEYLPIQEISAEASREKSVRKGHISTLHLWWARRPLVACRAAVYGSLVPADQFQPSNGPEEKRASLGRANAKKFLTRLCRYPGDPEVIKQAQEHILEAHARRLTAELRGPERPAWVEEFSFVGDRVTVEDIKQGRAPRPRVLDMFAGGGSIPLEALRLGCEAHALELNPVAYLILLCTLVYPQMYGKPDPTARGMTGPPGPDGQPTWGGLAEEVRWWGNWVIERVRREVGDLYPPVPDPQFKGTLPEIEFDRETGYWVAKGARGAATGHPNRVLWGESQAPLVPPGYMTPVAYLWTRTVTCKNPHCGATVPLVRQTWLCRKSKRYVALRMVAPRGEKRVRFEVVEAATEKGLGFDPAAFSKAGNAVCPFCGTVADSDYVKAEGCAKRMGAQMMAVVCTRPGKQGKVYVSADSVQGVIPDVGAIEARISALCQATGLTVPDEPVQPRCHEVDRLPMYGMHTWGRAFTPRQMLCLLTFAAAVRSAQLEMLSGGYSCDVAKGLTTYLALLVDRQADYNSGLCHWHVTRETIGHTLARQALPMVWDFAELAPFGGASGSPEGALDWIVGVIEAESGSGLPGKVVRGSATELPWAGASFDAVVSDPPYYDNIGYADVSDFFYVWLRRTVSGLHPEHFGTESSPKRKEIVAAPHRHSGDKAKARAFYEAMMEQAFREAHRVLKPAGQMTVVYAHKTTAGWSTLVEALRRAGFTVTEAWPLDTEMAARVRAPSTASLVSSVFLVARKRGAAGVGSYEREVRPELEAVVRERVDTLWQMGISGADLVIAAVGAGLRPYTRFERVEYDNGEEVPPETFLAEVEGVVLDTLLERIFGRPKAGVSAVDTPTRFYVLWRFTYRQAEVDAGEVIVFAYPQGVELDGPHSLSYGAQALLEKKKDKYRLRDFAERGDDEKLGLPRDDGTPAPLIDVLHRVLWLMENRPGLLPDYLDQARPNVEQLRLVAQALAGPALEGTPDLGTTRTSEQSALRKLLTNWHSLVEDNLFRAG